VTSLNGEGGGNLDVRERALKNQCSFFWGDFFYYPLTDYYITVVFRLPTIQYTPDKDYTFLGDKRHQSKRMYYMVVIVESFLSGGRMSSMRDILAVGLKVSFPSGGKCSSRSKTSFSLRRKNNRLVKRLHT
jgi:hypothetical protein